MAWQDEFDTDGDRMDRRLAAATLALATFLVTASCFFHSKDEVEAASDFARSRIAAMKGDVGPSRH
jgi:hypothetical protein